jgi:hypothetical protein
MKEWVLLWPGRTFGLFCQHVPCLSTSNPYQSVTKEMFVCATKDQMRIYTQQKPEGDPVQISSRGWISCSLKLEVWSEFKLIQDWIVLVSFEFDTVRFLGH